MLLLSLLGEQPIPNLLPLWHAPAQYRAVQFAATQKTLPLAKTLAQAIQKDPQLGHLDILRPLKLEAYHIGQARACLSAELATLHHKNMRVTLNLTGGTKLMSLAALQAAFGSGSALLYVSTEEGQIIHFASDGAETGREALCTPINVRQYLQAHGLEVSDNNAFNPHAGRSFAPPKQGDQLEEKVFNLAKASGFFDDVQRGVFIRRHERKNEVVNELDIVVTRNGRLAVCSCKSGNNPAKDSLYELSALSRREAAGIYCGKVMALSQEPNEAFRERARQNNIHLVYGNELNNAAEHLRLATTR